MNPQVVCSVAGLCNNERVQNLLNEQDRTVTVPKSRGPSNNCKGCHTVVDLVEKKFQSSNRDQVLQGFLQVIVFEFKLKWKTHFSRKFM